MEIPLAFRAQIEGRCQTQYPQTKDAERWVNDWVENLDSTPYQWPQPQTAQLQTRTYQFDWRFVTNGGQDDGIIRPVIGAGGLPYYPGSSMKGAFRQACTPEQVARYCGREDNDPAAIPLRFLGGYVQNEDWSEKLLDLTHPQQKWQVQTTDTKDKPSGE
ncbi:MAG: RAMP superfamily protein, partial [Spirulinaceae cyanobacterium]